MSRATIEIELAEGMASDDQSRILIIPWTPPSPHRRREIIQGQSDRPSAISSRWKNPSRPGQFSVEINSPGS
jgi:hypothetical protein